MERNKKGMSENENTNRVWLTFLWVYVAATLITFAILVCYPWIRLFACCTRAGIRVCSRVFVWGGRCCTRSAKRLVRYTSVAFSEQSRQPFIAERVDP